MGLACSHLILKALKGSIRLKESQKGFTKFEIIIPVEISEGIIQSNFQLHIVVFNHGRRLNDKLIQYLGSKLEVS